VAQGGDKDSPLPHSPKQNVDGGMPRVPGSAWPNHDERPSTHLHCVPEYLDGEVSTKVSLVGQAPPYLRLEEFEYLGP